MAFVDGSPAPAGPAAGWGTLRQLSKYQWFVFAIATLAWVADCMDQQLFNLVRRNAMIDLLGTGPTDPRVKAWAGYSTSIFLIGWACGGLYFGVLGDKIGRVRTLSITILLYSAFTGLSAASVGVIDFAFYRFLTGLGVGGVFAVAVSLLAETMPTQARPYTLGLLQACSAIGNSTAALMYIALSEYGSLLPLAGWRAMFLIGILPAILVLLMRGRVKEPEAWLKSRAERADSFEIQKGKYGELFRDPVWRRHALFGMLLAFAGVVGLWGIGFFSIDLVQYVLRESYVQDGLSAAEVSKKMMFWAGISSLLLNVGAFFGMSSFSWVTHYIGRRWAFAVIFVCAGLSTAALFLKLETRSQVYWMYPIVGFFQLGIFGGYAIYLPELFPTRLRSTGTSFCYNVGRLVAAVGPFMLGVLTASVFTREAGYTEPENFRYAGATMCSVYLLGLIALPFLPETRGKPLPE